MTDLLISVECGNATCRPCRGRGYFGPAINHICYCDVFKKTVVYDAETHDRMRLLDCLEAEKSARAK